MLDFFIKVCYNEDSRIKEGVKMKDLYDFSADWSVGIVMGALAVFTAAEVLAIIVIAIMVVKALLGL